MDTLAIRASVPARASKWRAGVALPFCTRGRHSNQRYREAISRRLKLPAASLSTAIAADHFGFLGHIIALDIHAASSAIRDLLDWQPTHSSLIEGIEKQGYR